MKDLRSRLVRGSGDVPLALPTVLVAIVVLALVLVSSVGLGPGKAASTDRPSELPSAAPSSRMASSSARTSSPTEPAPTLGQSPTGSALPSASPSPAPTIREAAAVARFPKCQDALGWDYVVSGRDLFIVCADPAEGVEGGPPYMGPYVARVDLSTNKVTATYRYKTPLTYIEGIAIAGGGLWFEGIFGGSGCAGDCDGWQRVVRFDLATGKQTLEMPNVSLQGFWFGSVWVRDNGFGKAPQQDRLRKLDPTTGRQLGWIPFSMDVVGLACGSLWGLTRNNLATIEESTTLARLDPSSGKALARFTEPGGIWGLQQVGNECWASVQPGSSDMDVTDYADHFVRIGDTGIDARSPNFHAGIDRNMPPDAVSDSEVRETWVDILGGAFWVVRDDIGSTPATLQRIDPLTWQPWGPVWRWMGAITQGGAFAVIDGSVWAMDASGGVVRLDIPI